MSTPVGSFASGSVRFFIILREASFQSIKGLVLSWTFFSVQLVASVIHYWTCLSDAKNTFVKCFFVFDFLLLFAWAMDYDSWTVDHSHVRPMDHGHSHGHDNVLWTMAMAMVHGPWPWTLCMNQGPWAWSMAMAWSIAMAMVHGPWPLSWPSVAHGPWPWPWSMVHGHYHGRLWPIDHGHEYGLWFMDIGPWPLPWS